MLNIYKLAVVFLSLIPNAYLIKSIFHYLPDVTLLLYIMCYLLFVIALFKRGNLGIKLGYFDFFVTLFLTLSIISVTYSPYPEVGLLKIAKIIFLGFGLMYLVRFFIRTKRDFDLLMKSYLVSSLLLGIIVILDFVASGMPFGRFSFYGAHPIPLSMMATTALLISLVIFVNKKLNVLYFVIISVVNVWVILVSSSRGPLLALGIVLILISPSIIRSFKKFISLIVISLVGFYFFSKTTQFEFLQSRLSGIGEDQSSIARMSLYNQAEGFISENPFLGKGLGIFNGKYPHNIFLEVYSDSGLIPVFIVGVLVLWLVYKYVSYLIKNRRNLYFYLPFVLTTASMIVLLYSFTYMDLKFLYLGLGLMMAQQNFLHEATDDVIVAESAIKEKKKRFKWKKYKIVW